MTPRLPSAQVRLLAWSAVLSVAAAVCALVFVQHGAPLALSWDALISLCGS